MALNGFKTLIVGLISVGIVGVVYQHTQTDKKASDKYQVSQERQEYLNKKYEKKLDNPKRYDKPKEAMQYYVDQRKPVGASNIPVERYQAARQHMNDMPRINSNQNQSLPSINTANLPDSLAMTSAATNFTSWASLGPGNVGGRTRTLAIDPNTPNTMYSAGVSGGIWKTTNGGSSWSPLDDLMNNMAVTTIVIDPNDNNTLYVGTGEGFFNIDAVRGDGIFKSTNAGASWTQLSTTSNNSNFHYVNKIVVSPNNSNRVYAATRAGIYRSIDGGATWTQMQNNGGTSVGCLDLQIRTDVNPDVLIASCGSFSQSTVYRSADGGDNWSSVLNESNMGRTTLAIAPSNQSTMYALAATNQNVSGNYALGLHAVFKSTDGGATWSATVRNTDSNKLNTLLLTNTLYAYYATCSNGSYSDQFYNQGWYDNIIAVDPVNENVVWAGGIDLFRSDNGGADWGIASYWWSDPSTNSYVHADQHGIYFHPDYNGTTNKTIFFSHDGGLSKSSNALAATYTDACTPPVSSDFGYTSLNNDYAVTQFYHGLASPDGTRFLGGTQDNGTILGSTSGGMIWNEVLGGDGGYVAFDPSNTNIAFASLPNGELYKSTNGGVTGSSAVNGITESSSNFAFITPYVMDPNNAQNLWIGGKTLWKTTDQATNWTQASTTDMLSDSASAWAVATGDSNYVAVGNVAGVIYYSTVASSANSSTSWSSSQPTYGTISSLTYDPNDKTVLYATSSTFGVDHILKSTDSGASWTAIDNRGSANGIPDIPVHTLAIDPDDSTRLFAGTDLGIFVSVDGGSNWAVENTGFINTVVENLQIVQSGGTNTLYAFTHGRGAWSTTLAASTASDSTPDVFSFTDQTGVATSTEITSAAITVAGINTTAAISVSGGSYSVNDGIFITNADVVHNGDTVKVRHTSSNNFGTNTDTVLTIGGVNDTFTSTTEAEDTTPTTFNFIDQTDVAISTQITSASITVAGINSAAAISVSGGEYSINSGTFTSSAGTVNNGDSVTVRHTSSSSFNTNTDTVLTIGGVNDTFTSTTEAEDTTPTAFNFVDQTDVAISTQTTSASITVAGINSAAAISVTGGEYQVNSDGFTNSAGSVNNGDTVVVRHTSSSSFNTNTDTVLTIGGVNDTFTSTTEAEDTTPTAFNFVDQTDVALSTQITSASITVAGINSAAAISVSGGEYQINSDGFTSSTGSVNNGDTVVVRHTASSDPGTDTHTTLNIGGVSDVFTSTTVGPDTTPTAFNFSDQNNIAISTQVTSNTITVSGINTATSISVTNGEYQIGNGSFTSTNSTVNDGDQVTVRHTSSGNFSSSTDTVLNIGGVTDTFTSTTLAQDTTPDAFSFAAVNDVALNTATTSNQVVISGITGSVTISVSNGDYAINNGNFTNAVGTVTNGNTVQVRHTSSNSFSTATNTTLTIGNISDTFTSTTLAEDITPDPFSFIDQTDVDAATLISSAPISVLGINNSASISITNGEYSINNGSFTSANGSVSNNDSVIVRHTSSSRFNATTDTTLDIGGVSDVFTSTTVADTDGDGSPDNQDTNPNDASIASVPDTDGGSIIIEASGTQLSNVENKTEESLNNTAGKPDDYQVIGNILSYDINGIANGATVTVTLTYPNAIAAGSKIYKIDDTNGYTEFSHAVISSDRLNVTLTLTDGGLGDADNSVNGVIDDPVVVMEPIVADNSSSSSSSSSGSGGGGSVDLILLLMLLSSIWIYSHHKSFSALLKNNSKPDR